MATSVFYLPGMDCPVEEKLVRDRLKSVQGIQSLDFNLLQRKLKVGHDPLALEGIAAALAGLDLGSTLLDPAHAADSPPQDKPIAWKKLAWALGLAAISEAADLHAEWGQAAQPIWAWLSLAFAIASICLCGLSTYKKGWLALKSLNLNINALMAVAVTGAAVIGQWPEAAMVMVLFNISEAIESRALLRARDAISGLVELAPHMAEIRQPDGAWAEEHAHDVAPGAIVRVKPGGKIPLDGRVVAGESAVNQAPITGESMPVEKRRGDFVYAGTLNGSGILEFEATASGQDTTLARIIHAVEEAQATKAPMQRFVDRFAAWYTPAIFLIAILCAIAPPLAWGAAWLPSIYTGLVMLVIGCPCALVISTPVSIVCGMAAATRSGILIKGGVFMEQGRLLRCIAFDKTGTITRGEPQVVDFEALNGFSAADAKRIAACLAASSNHPVSAAILAYCGMPELPVSDFQAVAGKGVAGRINGSEWRLGNLAMGASGQEIEAKAHEIEAQGKTVTLLYGPDGAAALFAVADAIRKGAKAAVEAIKKRGIVPVMLTGDNPVAAKAIADEAGIAEVKAGLLPEQKLRAIEELEARYGMAGMVGDGINDAPALAKANISFAMAKDGTATAIETADVALMDDDLGKIPRFLRLSSSTFAILVENIAIALSIKLVFFALALLGMATMWMAVFADVGAALIVICNGMRALRK